VTTIEWAKNADGTAGETWNPTTGCDQISPGCDNCYAMVMAARLKAMGQAKYQRDGDPRTSGPGFGLTVHPTPSTFRCAAGSRPRGS
jgi:protein gp37